MITRCPGCGTAFRVNQEQLDAREGKVRCGRCATVFDATNSLLPATDDVAAEIEALERATRDLPIPEPEAPASRSESQSDLQPEEQESLLEQDGEEAREPAETWDEPLAPVRKRPTHRGAWLAGGVVLLLALLAQAAMQYRGEIALLIPDTRPYVDRLCAALDCEVPLPRRADLVGIETSDLQGDPTNPSVMVLTATLRNRAAYAQAYPALELTLTDSQDQPLARRVLAARDYLGQGASLKAGFAASSELQLKVFLEAASLKATGYRLYLFYP